MTETLYSELLKVTFKCKNSEDRIVPMEITVGTRTTPGSSDKKHILVTLLPEDFSSLYHLCLGEDDFQIMKTEQGLLIDFSAFPEGFISLLQRCHKEETKKKPNFFLQFQADRYSLLESSSTEAGSLQVLEANPLKHLSHLSLKLVPINDEDITRHMVSCMQESLEKEKKLEEKLFSTERDLTGKLDEAHQEFSTRNEQLNQLQVENTEKLRVLIATHAKEVELKKEKAQKLQEKMQQRYNHEKDELQSSYQNLMLKKESQLSAMNHLNEELSDKLNNDEKKFNSVKIKLALLEENYEKYKVALEELGEKNIPLEAKRHELNKKIHELKNRLVELEQELSDREGIIARISASVDAFQQQKEKDVTRLQRELAAYVELARSKSEDFRQQKSVLEDMKQTYEKVKVELKEKNTLLKASEGKVNKVKEQMEKTMKELDAVKYRAGKNEGKIMRLNQQLIEKQNCVSETQSRTLLMCNSNTLHPPILIYGNPLNHISPSSTTSNSDSATSRYSSGHNLPKSKKDSSINPVAANLPNVNTNTEVKSQKKKAKQSPKTSKQPSETAKQTSATLQQPSETSKNKIGVAPKKSYSADSIKSFQGNVYPTIYPLAQETDNEAKNQSLALSFGSAIHTAMHYFTWFSKPLSRHQSLLEVAKLATSKASVASSSRQSAQVQSTSSRSQVKSPFYPSKSSKSKPSS